MWVAGRILVWRHQDLFQGVRWYVLGTARGMARGQASSEPERAEAQGERRLCRRKRRGHWHGRFRIGQISARCCWRKKVMVHCGQHFAKRSAAHSLSARRGRGSSPKMGPV